MGERFLISGSGGKRHAVFGHEFCAEGFWIEVDIAGSDAVHGLHDFPLFRGIAHGALNDFSFAGFEAAEAPRCAKRIEAMSARPSGKSRIRSGGTGRGERGFLGDGAVAVHAIDFDGGARLTVNFRIAVVVLAEMAIGALHAFFEMNVGEVNGFAEAIGIVEGNDFIVGVEPVPFSIVFVNAAENPAVAVKVGELRCLELFVEFGGTDFVQKFLVAPKAAGGCCFRIAERNLITILFARIVLFLRIHFLAVDFVVPPGEAEISGEHVRARVNVTDHALAGRNGTREDVFDRMTGFVLGNCGIDCGGAAKISVRRVLRGMQRIAVVRVDDVARGAATRAIVAGMIVGDGHRHDGIDEARFLETQENGIGAQLASKATVAQFVVGLAGRLVFFRIADFAFFLAAAFEDAENVAGLRNLPAEKWFELRKNTFGACFLWRWRGNGFERLRLTVAVVAFAEASVFGWVAAVVVERGAPQHSGVRHHAV